MVTDTRGRIQFASGPMAAMVGYPVKTLTDGMTLGGLMPPPYAQLHAQFMKVSVWIQLSLPCSLGCPVVAPVYYHDLCDMPICKLNAYMMRLLAV